MSDASFHDLLIIGAGVAGLAAAREARHAGMSTAYLEAHMFGGLVLNVNQLDGAVEGSGAEYASNLMMEGADLGVESLEGAVHGIETDQDMLVVTSPLGHHRARAVIIASGATRTKLGVPGESEFESKGVAHCADCDAPMYRDQQVVVAGGGDSALQSALVLAQYCSRVVVLQRDGSLTGKAHLAKAVQQSGKIKVRLNSRLSEILGNNGVEGVRVNDEVIPCTGVFAYVGLEPATDYLPEQVQRDERGAVITNADMETAMAGVFAAGAVRSGCGGMIEDAVSDGMSAARAATRHVRRMREMARA